MMIGDRIRSNPTVQISPWDYNYSEDPASHLHSPITHNGDASHYDKALAALQRYLPSNKDDVVQEKDGDSDDFDFPVDAFSCDNFRMFEFKVKKCARARSHDWTECPFAHPGEKARRRDPRKYHYAGSACPDFRKGGCKRGDACEYAHGVFECWLHPARYRTQPCKDGTHCRRRVCFFAHTPDQLRILPYSSPDDSPGRMGCDSPGHPCYGSFVDAGSFISSPIPTMYSPPPSPKTASPPMSPSLTSLSQLTESVRYLQLNKASTGLGMGPPSWGLQMGSGFVSPRSPSALRVGHTNLPVTRIRAPIRSGPSAFDIWETSCEEEPIMERVESGKKLRDRIYAKLSKENSLNLVDSAGSVPDLGWISELVK